MLNEVKHLNLISLQSLFDMLRVTQCGRAGHINMPTTEVVKQFTDGIKRPAFVMLSVAKHPGLIYTFSPENIPRFRFSLFCAFLWCGREGR